MRVVVRVLLIEFSLAWTMIVVGSTRVAVQVWPIFARTFGDGWRRWRAWVAASIAVPVTVGWPLLFWLIQAEPGYRAWLPGIAIPWWIVLAGTGARVLFAKVRYNTKP